MFLRQKAPSVCGAVAWMFSSLASSRGSAFVNENTTLKPANCVLPERPLSLLGGVLKAAGVHARRAVCALPKAPLSYRSPTLSATSRAATR